MPDRVPGRRRTSGDGRLAPRRRHPPARSRPDVALSVRPPSSSPQPHDAAVVADTHSVAVTHCCPQGEPQTLHIRRQLDGAADDLTGMGVRPEMGVIVANTELLALPGDDERVGGFHRVRLRPLRCHLGWRRAARRASRRDRSLIAICRATRSPSGVSLIAALPSSLTYSSTMPASESRATMASSSASWSLMGAG